MSRKMLASTTGPRLLRELKRVTSAPDPDQAIEAWVDKMKPGMRTLTQQVLQDYRDRYRDLEKAVNIVLWDMGQSRCRVEYSVRRK